MGLKSNCEAKDFYDVYWNVVAPIRENAAHRLSREVCVYSLLVHTCTSTCAQYGYIIHDDEEYVILFASAFPMPACGQKEWLIKA